MNIIERSTSAFPDEIPSGMEEQYQKIIEWREVYKNNPQWISVKKSGLFKNGQRIMERLNVAKILCDEFSSLTFSEQVDITVNDEIVQEYVNDVLEMNGFWKNIPEFLSTAYAMGGGVIKVFIDKAKPCLDYVNAYNFAPTEWTNKNIKSGIFETQAVKGKKHYTLFEKHYSENNLQYVEHRLFCSECESEIGDEIDLAVLYPQLPPTVCYNTDVSMLSYFKPSISNNVDDNTPLGISVFASCQDTLKSLDIAFDSLSREFVLGKKRIIVPSSCIQTVFDIESEKSMRYFDADDEAFVALSADDNQKLQITDNTIELRIDEHISAINALLNILCFQTGLSSGTLSFCGAEGVKTATEIVSRDSKTARTIKSHKNILTETIESVVESIIAIGVYLGNIADKDYDVTIGWKDNIIVDDNTMIDNNIKLVGAGLKSKLSAIMEILKCDEKTAEKELELINKEQSVTGLAVDDFMGKSEKPEELEEVEPDESNEVDGDDEI